MAKTRRKPWGGMNLPKKLYHPIVVPHSMEETPDRSDTISAARERYRRAQVRLRLRARSRNEAKRLARTRHPDLKVTHVLNEDWDRRQRGKSRGSSSSSSSGSDGAGAASAARWVKNEAHMYIVTGYHTVADKLARVTPEERERFVDACARWALENEYERRRLDDTTPLETLSALRAQIEAYHQRGVPPHGAYFDRIQSKYGLTDREMDELHTTLTDDER